MVAPDIVSLNNNPAKPAVGKLMERDRGKFSAAVYTKQFIIILFSIFLVQDGYSQDLHFSQWFNSPLTTNPANTGFIPDADYRVGANYRNQWSSVMTVPYKTMSAYG